MEHNRLCTIILHLRGTFRHRENGLLGPHGEVPPKGAVLKSHNAKEDIRENSAAYVSHVRECSLQPVSYLACSLTLDNSTWKEYVEQRVYLPTCATSLTRSSHDRTPFCRSQLIALTREAILSLESQYQLPRLTIVTLSPAWISLSTVSAPMKPFPPNTSMRLWRIRTVLVFSYLRVSLADTHYLGSQWTDNCFAANTGCDLNSTVTVHTLGVVVGYQLVDEKRSCKARNLFCSHSPS